MKTPVKTKQSAKKSPATPIAKKTAPAKTIPGKAILVKSKIAFQGKVFSVTTDTVTEPNGGGTNTRDVIRHNGSVIILAVDSRTNSADPTIVIERQYRHAAGQFLLELPAGRIEPGERPLAAAKRELIEETGYRAKRWSPLVKYYASPGFLAEYMQVFLAEDIYEGIAEPEEDEKIELLRIPVSELLTMIHAGKVQDGKTILSILLYVSQKSFQ